MTFKPRLIGLYAPVPGSGKTTAAECLGALGYTRLSFADPLKRLTIGLLMELGLTRTQARHYVYTAKEERIPSINTTGRHLLQTLATEYGRQCVHPDLWIKCARPVIDNILDTGGKVVFDDMRFPNEFDLIQGYGGSTWRIFRPGLPTPAPHASNYALETCRFDVHLRNAEDLITFRSDILTHLYTP